MIKNSFFKSILFALTIVLFAACDNDFNVLGTDLVGVDNFGFGTPVTYDITTTNADLGPAESTNLALNPLGIYNNPVFGEMTANFVTQVVLATENPTIDPAKIPTIDNVVLRIPYFTRSTAAPYTLDSIYGPNPYSKMKLSIYESGYFIRDLNPADQLAQAYYTDQNQLFEDAVIGNPLNAGTDSSQNDEFTVSAAATTTTTYNATTGAPTDNTVAPAINLKLSNVFFTSKILNAPTGKLLNNNIFKDYFRGLYFKLEKNGDNPGNMAMLNFKGGTVTINYHEYATVPVSGATTPPAIVYKTIVLNLTGKSVSLIEQADRNSPTDSKDLYLKGGAGQSMAVIDIKKTDIDQMRDSNWLINDASITFNIDKAKMLDGNNDGSEDNPKAVEPLRVYLYDLNNKRQIIDYSTDQTSVSSNTKLNKYVFGGIINKQNGRGYSYKIRLTNHIRSLIQHKDSTDVRLGLVVTETINDVGSNGNKRLKNPVSVANNPNGANPFNIKTVPTMTVVHPLGTILFGSDIPAGDADYDKRPKLQIYYTQLKQN